MKLLVDESPLIVLPNLAARLGINEAIVLQQLHFRLSQSPLKFDGYTWYQHTYVNWQKQFPFWSEKTISRVFLRLEEAGIVVSTDQYNTQKVNKTKWYRIDYDVLYAALDCQNGSLNLSKCLTPTEQAVSNVADELAPSDLKDLKKEENKENNVVLVAEVINYLNHKAQKEFRTDNKATVRLINGRISEGYTLEDFKRVIDIKVQQWLTNPNMKQYLRPSTLFSPTNFENYLNEMMDTQPQETIEHPIIQPIVLDFDAGEEEYDGD